MSGCPGTLAGKLWLVLLFFSLVLQAQDRPADSKETIADAINKYEKGFYKDAINMFRKVPEGDTNYLTAQYELALTYLADSAYEEAQATALQCLEHPYANKRDFLLTLAHAYDYRGLRDSAVRIYDSLIAGNPTDHQPYYEKAISYFYREDYEKATALLEQALMINPYHFRSHNMLGTIFGLQGRLTEAFIALEMSLLTTTDAKLARNSILLLNTLTKQTEEVSKAYERKAQAHHHPVYDEIDMVLNARLAANKSYKVPSALDEDNLIRNAYMILDKLSYEQEDKNFVMQYYVPALIEVREQKLFDPFMLLLFSNYGIDVVERLAKKEQKDIKTVRSIIFPYLNQIVATRVLPYESRKKASRKYNYVTDERVYAIANIRFSDGETRFLKGPASFYREGVLAARGAFNDAGKREGAWQYYYPNGTLRQTEFYSNGTVQGDVAEYNIGGQLRSVDTYDGKGAWTGEKEYAYNGILSASSLRLDKERQKMTAYHPNGLVEREIVVANGKVSDGVYKEFDDGGRLSRVFTMKDGKLNGACTTYHENGKIRETMIFKNGNKHGEAISYYADGVKESVGEFDDGSLAGVYQEFDREGALVEKTPYRRGKKDGREELYTGGRLYGTVTYSAGKVEGYAYFDTAGKVIAQHSDGALHRFVSYYPGGVRKFEVGVKEGLFDGEASYYYTTGNISSKTSFRKGYRHGSSTDYFRLGKVKSVMNYEEGAETGMLRSYHSNGKPRTEGWLQEGTREGRWLFYNVDGSRDAEGYYVGGKLNGPYRHYKPNGRLSHIEYYDRGMLMGLEQFDTSGARMSREFFPAGNGRYRRIYPNGNVYFECALQHGELHGLSRKYFPDGKTWETAYYRNGEQDSMYHSYFHNGKLQSVGMLSKHGREGLWKTYAEDGSIVRETNYLKGQEHGSDRMYVNGELRREYDMREDRIEGLHTLYGDDRKAACILHYKDNDLQGYSYLGKDGNPVAMIPLKAGTGTVRCFYPDGTLSAELNFLNNLYDGRQKLYYSNGQLAEERIFSNADVNGPLVQYFKQGQVRYRAIYKDDELDGEENYFDQEGKLVKRTLYLNGYANGLQQLTDPATGQSTSIFYFYGTPVSVQ